MAVYPRRGGLAVALAIAVALVVVLAGCSGQAESGLPGESAVPHGSERAVTDCEPERARPSESPSSDPLTIGSLLPEGGNLAFFGPPQFAAIEVAVADVNAAGGVLGEPVTHIRGDSGDETTAIGEQTVGRHLDDDVEVIMGAASSAVTRLVIDTVTDAGTLLFSPAATSDEFTCWSDHGLFFRTAPPDRLQARAVAELIVDDGAQRVSILARDDAYGANLAANTERVLLDLGLQPHQLQKVIYEPDAGSFNREIAQLADFGPQAILLLGFEESQQILTRMNDIGIGPRDLPVYGTDGNMDDTLGEGLPPGALEGMQGTAPRTELPESFQQELRAQDSELAGYTYAAEAYDAVVLTALAAEQAQSTRSQDIAAALVELTSGGQRCTDYASCLAVIDSGDDANYDGMAGPLPFTPAGEPATGNYGILRFTERNEIADEVRYVTVGG